MAWLNGKNATRSGQVVTPRIAFSLASLKERLGLVSLSHGPLLWLAVLVPTLLGALLRFVRLGSPDKLVFDETYYVKDAFSLLKYGTEMNWTDKISSQGGTTLTQKPDELFTQGNFSALGPSPEYVVHPPLGKWMIGWGIKLFGADNPFAWRFSAALVGTLAIAVLVLVAYRLFRSIPLSFIAGLFFAVDGQAIVMSRTSLLDIFLTFWLLLAFAALLMDRYHSRERLANLIASAARRNGGVPTAAFMRFGPFLGWRPWRLAAAVALGLALGTKWSALSFIAVFGIMSIAWDASARRVVGVRHWIWAALGKDGLFAAVTVLPVTALTYLLTWSGWLLGKSGYDRTWAQTNSSGFWDFLPHWLRSLAEYHRSAYQFHQGLSAYHPYAAPAWKWLWLGRPTSFAFSTHQVSSSGKSQTVENMVTDLGNPLIWWGGALAILATLILWLWRRDWRAGAILSGIVAGYAPWFLYPERTVFFFYAISFEPWLILALVYCLGALLGPATADRTTADVPTAQASAGTSLSDKTASAAAKLTGISWGLRQRWIFVWAFVVLVLLCSAFFYPIWTGEDISTPMRSLRMWFRWWI